jgi:hypothetical protein
LDFSLLLPGLRVAAGAMEGCSIRVFFLPVPLPEFGSSDLEKSLRAPSLSSSSSSSCISSGNSVSERIHEIRQDTATCTTHRNDSLSLPLPCSDALLLPGYMFCATCAGRRKDRMVQADGTRRWMLSRGPNGLYWRWCCRILRGRLSQTRNGHRTRRRAVKGLLIGGALPS